VLDPTIIVLRNLVLSLFQIVQAMYYLEEIVWTICLLIVVDYARFFSLRIASVTPQQPAQLRTRAVWWLCALVHRLLTLYVVTSSTLFFDFFSIVEAYNFIVFEKYHKRTNSSA
jgi:hypothetical protein